MSPRPIVYDTTRAWLDAEASALRSPPLRTIVDLAADVNHAVYGCETQTEREYVVAAEKALATARASGVTREIEHAIGLVAHLAKRARLASGPDIVCSICGDRHGEVGSRLGSAMAQNIGWRGLDTGHVLCPSCWRSQPANDPGGAVPTVQKVRVASKSRPSESHEVTLECGRATTCGCEGNAVWKRRCHHMKTAESAVKAVWR